MQSTQSGTTDPTADDSPELQVNPPSTDGPMVIAGPVSEDSLAAQQVPPNASAGILGPKPQVPIPPIPPPPQPGGDQRQQFLRLLAAGFAAGLGPRGGGAGALQGIQTADQQIEGQRMLAWKIAAQNAQLGQQEAQHQQQQIDLDYRQRDAQIRQTLQEFAQQASKPIDQDQYERLVQQYTRFLRAQGYRIAPQWFYQNMPYAAPTDRDKLQAAVTYYWAQDSTKAYQKADPNHWLTDSIKVPMTVDGHDVTREIKLPTAMQMLGISYGGQSPTGSPILTTGAGASMASQAIQLAAADAKAMGIDLNTPRGRQWYATRVGTYTKQMRPPQESGFLAGILEGADPKAIAEAIREGKFSPEMRGFTRYTMDKVSSELAKRGPNGEPPYDLASAQRTWQAQLALNRTMNNSQQVRLDESIRSSLAMYDRIDELADQWNSKGWGPLSRANLRLAQEGAYGQTAQSVANQLVGQISQLTSDVAQVEQGGLTPTNESRAVANQTLQAWWGRGTITDMTTQGRWNMQVRELARRTQQPQVMGNPGAGVNPPPAEPATPGAVPNAPTGAPGPNPFRRNHGG